MVTTGFEPDFLHHGVFWVAVAFVVFFTLFGGRLWKVVSGLLDRRIDQIRRQLEEAAQLRAEAEAMLAAAERTRAEALVEAQAVLERAKHEAALLTESLTADAAQAAARRERLALERIAAAEKSVTVELRLAAVDLAARAAAAAIEATLSPSEDADLIDRAIAALPASMRAA